MRRVVAISTWRLLAVLIEGTRELSVVILALVVSAWA
jgi:hypothetical protein